MLSSRARLTSIRAVFVVALVLGSVIPVLGASSVGFITGVSSPTSVTVGRAVAFPISVQNTGGNTLNHVEITGSIDGSFAFLFATPTTACVEQTCTFDRIAAGEATPQVVFYFRAPLTALNPAGDEYTFTATARVGEGGTDNSNAAHDDTFWTTIATLVRPESPDFVSGHALDGERDFTTGLGNLSATNQHGTAVLVPRDVEVTIGDVAPAALPACPAELGTCFGWGSQLDVGHDIGGAEHFAEGISVTIRWDATQLPKGMTARKLRVVHILDEGGHEVVSGMCVTDPATGLVVNMPCFTVAPFAHRDKDIQATMLWDSNGIGRGW